MDNALIKALADGHFHSGEAIGRHLGISRAAVWKRLRRLSDYGLELERVPGRGYRLPGGLSLLCGDEVRNASALSDGELDLVILDSIDSTNAEALRLAGTGLARPLAVLAEHQHAGRGRRGRAWESPYGSNLYLSMAREFGAAARLEGLSLAVGVAVVEALAELGLAHRMALKWPNDIRCGQHKLGGVLVELTGDLDDSCMAVIGIGLNGAMSDTAASRIDQPWTDLRREFGHLPDRSRLAGRLLAHLSGIVESFAEAGFAPLRHRWEKYDCCCDHPVRVEIGGRSVDGVARGVDERGGLRVETGGRIQTWYGGEVSLRLT